MYEDFEKIDGEIETFKVNGKITRDTELKWLEFKGIIKQGKGIYSYSYALIYPKGLTEQEVSQRYFKFQNIFESYVKNREKVSVGNMGVKSSIITNKIDAESIPF